MLLYLFLAVFIVSIFAMVGTKDSWGGIGEAINTASFVTTILSAAALLIMIVILIFNRTTPEADYRAWLAKYESLTFQYENNFYDNDNDIGKKELMDDILEDNRNVISGQCNKDNYWIGVFVPDFYDDLPIIDLGGK